MLVSALVRRAFSNLSQHRYELRVVRRGVSQEARKFIGPSAVRIGFRRIEKTAAESQRNFSTSRAFCTNTMPPAGIGNVKEFVQKVVADHDLVVFTLAKCPFCIRAKALLNSLDAKFEEVVVDQRDDQAELRAALLELHGQKTFPQVFVKGALVGGFDDINALNNQGQLYPLVRRDEFDFDLVVVGGGSGGLAAAKEAGVLGARVCAIDYVDPTPSGNKWGIGGTCVNVGCIPKKLMHQAALLRDALHDSVSFGWTTEEAAKTAKNVWSVLVQNVNAHIKSLNFKERVGLRQQGIEYINGRASFVDAHTVETVAADGKTRRVTAKHIIVATGLRPTYLEAPNARELTITSDDLFQLPREPGRTLVVGASYVALECAGFLAGIGYDVTVMVRSILLRGFDQQMANVVGEFLESAELNRHPVRFVRECIPIHFEQVRPWNKETGELPIIRVKARFNDGSEFVEEFNSVLLAIGRSPRTAELKLDQAGVKTDKSGKIIADDADCTNIPHIFAIGDVAVGRPELTPSAIEAGQLLARRLYKGGTTLTDYVNIPTTVFTPLEYGACGYAEEQAIEKFGEENIEVYHTRFTPLEWIVPHRADNACYIKLICLLPEEKVIGFHCVSPNAGEVTQGFGVAMKAGATKAHFDATIGIHPTSAENFTTLTVTKRSGKDASKKGC